MLIAFPPNNMVFLLTFSYVSNFLLLKARNIMQGCRNWGKYFLCQEIVMPFFLLRERSRLTQVRGWAGLGFCVAVAPGHHWLPMPPTLPYGWPGNRWTWGVSPCPFPFVLCLWWGVLGNFSIPCISQDSESYWFLCDNFIPQISYSATLLNYIISISDSLQFSKYMII